MFACPGFAKALPRMISQFISNYSAVLKDIYGETKPEWCVPQSEIETAESRLNAKLPGVLADVYRLCGRFERLHKSHDRLRELVEKKSMSWRSGEALERKGDHIVFYEENQCVSFWSFATKDARGDDPAIFVAEDLESEWESWGCSMSEFLQFELHWQLTNGAAPVGGLAEIDQPTVESIRSQFPLALQLGGTLSNCEVFYKDGLSVVVFKDDSAPGGYFMHCGMKSEDKFDAVQDMLNIEEWYDNWMPGDGTHDD